MNEDLTNARKRLQEAQQLLIDFLREEIVLNNYKQSFRDDVYEIVKQLDLMKQKIEL